MIELFSPKEKTASIEGVSYPTNIADLLFLAKERDNYYLNGEQVTIKQASEFISNLDNMDIELSDLDKHQIMLGGNVCIDNREKTASIILPRNIMEDKAESSNCCIATSIKLDGNPVEGFVYRMERYHSPSDYSPNTVDYTYLFIGEDFYSEQSDLVLLDRKPVTLEELQMVSVPTDPLIGMSGVVS